MKFYYDGVLICGAKTQKYKYAIVIRPARNAG